MQRLTQILKYRSVKIIAASRQTIVPQSASFFNSHIFRSEEEPKKSDDAGGRKVPSGFEKLLKKSKRGSTKDEKDAKKKDDEQSDHEEETTHKEQKKEEKTSETKNSTFNFRDQFFEPNGGGPKWENWLLVGFSGALAAYYFSSTGKKS
jgi:hypothetical protein